MRISHCLALILVSVVVVQPAGAQWAVIDAPAIVQLIQEVQTMEQEVQTARDQLSQAKQALDTMTGDRGMEMLLSGTTRNYLPTSWSQLMGAIQGGGGYSGLAADVRGAIGANARIGRCVCTMSPSCRVSIRTARSKRRTAYGQSWNRLPALYVDAGLARYRACIALCCRIRMSD